MVGGHSEDIKGHCSKAKGGVFGSPDTNKVDSGTRFFPAGVLEVNSETGGGLRALFFQRRGFLRGRVCLENICIPRNATSSLVW